VGQRRQGRRAWLQEEGNRRTCATVAVNEEQPAHPSVIIFKVIELYDIRKFRRILKNICKAHGEVIGAAAQF